MRKNTKTRSTAQAVVSNQFRSSIAVLLASMSLVACGGGGNGQSATLLPEAAGCAYLVELGASVSDINQYGCTYNDENNQVAYWAGTEGTWGPNAAADAISDDDDDDDVSGEVVTPQENTGTGTNTNTNIVIAEPGVLDASLADIDNNPNLYANTPTSAVLNGPVYGENIVANSAVRKSIGFHVDKTENGLSIEHALIFDISPNERSYILLYVKNNSNKMQCFVNVSGVTAYDSNNNLITDFFGFVGGYADGSVGLLSFVETSSCIQPGDINYLSIYTDLSMNDVTAISIDELASSERDDAILGRAVEPVSYDVVDGQVNILLANRGIVDIEIFSMKVVVLDEQGFPIGWDLEILYEELAPGEEFVFIPPFSRFTLGSSSSMRVMLDYDLVE